MPGKLGTQFLEETIKTRPYQTGILLSAFTDDQEVLEAGKRNFIYKTIEKPLNEQLLKGYILEGFQNYQKHSRSPLKK
ncbi:MAG: hypothetical protein K0R26_1307 [Bacteroidota bacterium]|jgi:hypothetical protein|nr:hypothetical protein [Bacteroidota bacterium]